jgi:hypothetical protein
MSVTTSHDRRKILATSSFSTPHFASAVFVPSCSHLTKELFSILHNPTQFQQSAAEGSVAFSAVVCDLHISVLMAHGKNLKVVK